MFVSNALMLPNVQVQKELMTSAIFDFQSQVGTYTIHSNCKCQSVAVTQPAAMTNTELENYSVVLCGLKTRSPGNQMRYLTS